MISYRFHVPDHIHSAEKRELERQDEIDERNHALPPPNSMKTIDNRGEYINFMRSGTDELLKSTWMTLNQKNTRWKTELPEEILPKILR